MAASEPSAERRSGFSVLEALIVVAVVGVLAGLAFALIPRQGMAVNQGERLLSTAVQFARFEAIRSNEAVVIELAEGATDLTVRWARGAADGSPRVLRTVSLNPQDGRVEIKESDVAEIVFNARGMAGTVSRRLTIGIVGSSDYNLRLEISPIGVIGRAGDG